MKNEKEIDLVLSGSGVRFPCFVGSLKALIENNYKIKRIIGTSGGAIVSALFTVYSNIETIEKLTLSFDFSELTDLNWLFYKGCCLYKGELLKKVLKKYFRDLYLSDVKGLNIISTSLDMKTYTVFNHMSAPTMPLYQAIYASVAAPFIFRPLEYRTFKYIDGGISNNFAFDYFDDGERKTIGCIIKGTTSDDKIKKVKFFQYPATVLGILMEAIEREHIEDVYWNNKLCQINVKDIPSFDFSITKDQKRELIKIGYDAMSNKLRNMEL